MCKECGAKKYSITSGMCAGCTLDVAMIEAADKHSGPASAEWYNSDTWNIRVNNNKAYEAARRILERRGKNVRP